MDLKRVGDKVGDTLFFLFILVLSSDLKTQKGFQVPAKSGFQEGAYTSKSMCQICNYDLTEDTVSSEGHVPSLERLYDKKNPKPSFG